MEKPEHGYCCSDSDMHKITDGDGNVTGYVCSFCSTVYKYKLEKED